MRWVTSRLQARSYWKLEHAITSCLEATRRCDAAPIVSSRSLGWVIPKPGQDGL